MEDLSNELDARLSRVEQWIDAREKRAAESIDVQPIVVQASSPGELAAQLRHIDEIGEYRLTGRFVDLTPKPIDREAIRLCLRAVGEELDGLRDLARTSVRARLSFVARRVARAIGRMVRK